MMIEFDPAKRAKILAERDPDIARAGEIFDGVTQTVEDDRFDYGETRWITFGYLDDRLVVVVWTTRGENRRIITMRKANVRETTAGPRRL